MNFSDACRDWIATEYPQASVEEKRQLVRAFFAGVRAHAYPNDERPQFPPPIDGTKECPDQLRGIQDAGRVL